MRRHLLLAAGLLAAIGWSGASLGWAAEEPQQRPTGRMTFTLRGGGVQAPAQAGAAAAGAHQAEADAAKAEAQAQDEQGRDRAEQLNQEALTRQNQPVFRFGVLGGPLSPTTPFSIRR